MTTTILIGIAAIFFFAMLGAIAVVKSQQDEDIEP